MPRALQGHASGGVDLLGLAYLTIILVVVFAPVIFARRRSQNGPDSGSDDDRGGGSPTLPNRPSSPVGGLPLPDAVQSRTRLRAHGRISRRL